MIDKKDLIIISGADSKRFGADINHKKYCDNQNIAYKFFIKTDVSPSYFIKCHCILEALKSYKYVLWIDDDAFFINNNWDCRTIFDNYSEDIIVTRGRNKKSGITLFNNGIIFIRNTLDTVKLFELMLSTPFKEVKENYKKEWGPIDTYDQSRMIYLTQKLFPQIVKIIDYPGFNAHEVTFKKRSFLETNPPIVHITGQGKEGKMKRFTNSTGIMLP